MIKEFLANLFKSLLASVNFYTIIPLPRNLNLEFDRLARWAPVVGLLLGLLLQGVDFGLMYLGMPVFTRTMVIVALWIGITGGLHLDGVMDSADGLAVWDKERRLEVMHDSATGAFGVMAALVVVGLKVAALTDLAHHRGLALMLAAGWGRCAQVVAIALYPYLKVEGKGAFHKRGMRLPQDVLLGLLLLAIFTTCYTNIGIGIVMSAIAFTTGFWYYAQLGGHTGDTYGAVVEWTEALILTFSVLCFG